MIRTTLVCVLVTSALAATFQASVEQLASLYSLTTSTTLPFPTATQSSSNTDSLLVSEWSLGKGRIQDGADNLAFVNDPFPTSNTSGPVLQTTYPAGGFSSANSGAQWYNLWNASDGSTFGTMMASYEVAFDSGFDWVQGGKLPGLRGGLDSTGCSGGNEAAGQDCFSSRLMWRQNAEGEVYAYIPTPNNLCSASNIICNSDYGTSISRGSFGFVSGQWNRITMLVRLNEPPNVANGNIQLFYNNLQAVDQQNLQIRSSDTVSVNGFYFSTFFGGNDQTWAPNQTTHAYFRNIRMWAANAPSNLTGQQVSTARRQYPVGLLAQITSLVLVGALFTI